VSDDSDEREKVGRTTMASSPVSKRLARLLHDEAEGVVATSPCPRCGAAAGPPRGPTPHSPFRKPGRLLTCSLCGLDYERGEPQWQAGELPRTLAPFLRPSK
jgi:hypothetical protein